MYNSQLTSDWDRSLFAAPSRTQHLILPLPPAATTVTCSAIGGSAIHFSRFPWNSLNPGTAGALPGHCREGVVGRVVECHRTTNVMPSGSREDA
jgi:hypothetical protein